VTLRLHVLASGHADTLVLELPSGRLAVVDFGHRTLLDYLTHLDPTGTRRFAFCLLTHAHKDHYLYLKEFIDRYDSRVDEYWFSVSNAGMIRDLLALQMAIANDERGQLLVQNSAQTPPHLVEPGVDVYRFAPTTRAVLQPPGARSTEENNRSIVLFIHYGACTLLLGGDAEEARWLAIQSQAATMSLSLQSDVVKAPHHGAAPPYGMPPHLWPLMLKPDGVVAMSCSRSLGKPDAATIAALPRRSVRCTGRAATCRSLPSPTRHGRGTTTATPVIRGRGLLRQTLIRAPEMRPVAPCFGSQIYEFDPGGRVTVTTAHTPAFLDACI